VLPRFLRPLFEHLTGKFQDRPQAGNVLLWILRGCFGAVIISMAMLAFRHYGSATDQVVAGWIAFLGILGGGFLVVLTDILIRNKQITTLSAIYFGLLLGLLLGNILSTALEPFIEDLDTQRRKNSATYISVYLPPAVPPAGAGEKPEQPLPPPITRLPNVEPSPENAQQKALIKLLLTVVCCYICISTLLQTKDEFRFIIPYVEFSKQVKGAKPLVLDTSVIIDGRIADICDTRFVDTRLIVPRFVLHELQSVADSSDKLKRNRGRRGLDMLKRMQNNPKVELQISEANLPELRELRKVDERLVALAKALDARVVTNDFNLNKIAQLQGVEVINLNELANALKSVALPGEILTVRLVKPGDQMGQGVGYLEDGTMVVVEQGRSLVGQEVTLAVTSVLQTPAGRMIFGRVEHRPPPPASAVYDADNRSGRPNGDAEVRGGND
jgi:uncharacterized protein YacL